VAETSSGREVGQGSKLHLRWKHKNTSKPIMFASDTSVIISSKCVLMTYVYCQTGPSCMNKWCTANTLAMNLNKMNII
jgi:hypothetical protein